MRPLYHCRTGSLIREGLLYHEIEVKHEMMDSYSIVILYLDKSNYHAITATTANVTI